MTKAELVNGLVKRTGLSTREANITVETFMDSIIDGVSKNKKVTMKDFGTFYPSPYPARKIKNPKTGEIISIDSKIRPLFRAGKNLKHMVNIKSSMVG